MPGLCLSSPGQCWQQVPHCHLPIQKVLLNSANLWRCQRKQYSNRKFKNVWTLSKESFILKTTWSKGNQSSLAHSILKSIHNTIPLREAGSPMPHSWQENKKGASLTSAGSSTSTQVLLALPFHLSWDTGRHGVAGTGFPHALTCGYLQSLSSHLLLLATAVTA